MVKKLSDIVEIRTIVERSALLPAKEVFLKRAAIIKIAHTSTSIEGNSLAEFEVAKIAQGGTVQAEHREIQEVKNYLKGLRFIDTTSEKQRSFNGKDILTIHKLVMDDLLEKENIGVWRKGPVYVVNIHTDGKETIAYTPPESKHVSTFIQELTHWLTTHEEIHPIIRAGIFHYQFETIHPFPDGNGRTGRLATLLHLYQSRWDFKKILVLEEFYNRNRKAYYQALQTGDTYTARQNADLTSWLEYFVDGFLVEATKVRDSVLNIALIPQQAGQTQRLTTDELKIVDFVLTIGRITSSDVVDILRIPKRTAQDKLKKLEDMKVLEQKEKGPATYYVIPKV